MGGGDAILKACIPANAFTHSANLGIAKRLASAEHEFVRRSIAKERQRDSRKPNRAHGRPGFRHFDFRHIPCRVRNGAADMQPHMLAVNVRPLEPEHLLQPKWVKRLQCQFFRSVFKVRG